MMVASKLIDENDIAFVFEGTAFGKPASIILLKDGCEVMVDMESVANNLGYKDSVEMMSDDSVLDSFREFHEEKADKEYLEWEKSVIDEIMKVPDKELRDTLIIKVKGQRI